MGELGYYERTRILWEERDIMRWPGYYEMARILWENWNILREKGYYGRTGILWESRDFIGVLFTFLQKN